MRKLLVLPLLLAAACDGGNGPSGSAQLTAAEAAQLTRAMFGMVSGVASSGIAGAGFNLAPMEQNSFTAPFQETVRCTPSGSTELEGTVTVAFGDISEGISMEADFSVAPDDCAHRLENGDVIKVTGDPDLDIHLVMAGTAEELIDLQVTEKGAFRWTRGGASGRCAVDLGSSLDAPTQMVTVSGTFCGFPVSETFPVEG
jgi:hypothetical protein